MDQSKFLAGFLLIKEVGPFIPSADFPYDPFLFSASFLAGMSTISSSDLTCQVAPPGKSPELAVVYWKNEGCMCFEVEAGGCRVSRRDGKSHRHTAKRTCNTKDFQIVV